MFSLKGQLPSGLGVRLVLRDARTGQIVENIRTFSIGDDTLMTFQSLLNHGSRQLRLVLQPVGVAQLKRISLERWFVVDETGQSALAKTGLPSSTLKQLPEAYAVHPSYPNPFNPSTTIKFDLPENSYVSLVVYDVLGRKVTDLVSGVQEAGFKSIQWDAANLASGIYFARFTAKDAQGNVKLSKVSKLLLAK
jgi:hypothetical protein